MEQEATTGTQRARLRWLFRGGLVLAAGLLLWYSGGEAGWWHTPAPAAPPGSPLAEPPAPSAVPTAEAAAAPLLTTVPSSAAQGTILHLPVISVGPPAIGLSPTRSARLGSIPPTRDAPLSPTPVDEVPEGTPSVPAEAAGASEQGAEPGEPAGRWIWPVQGRISQSFSPSHRAIDIVADHGTLVRSADAGRVVYARWEISGYGYLVIVDHGDGYRSFYGHLYGFYVDVGQEVARGDLLGQLGNTGDSTGPHLHFEIRYQGSHLNPLDVLPAGGQ